jgi:hypothetical protein
MLCTPSTSRITPTGNHGNHGTEHVTSTKNWIHLTCICDEGFNAVVKKNKKPSDLPSLEEHKKGRQLQPVAIKSSSSLHDISKKFKLKSLFVSRISTHVSPSFI